MSILWDNHMHSSFSGDCNTVANAMIQEAKSKNLSGITFTDHLDLDYQEDPGLFNLDIDNYQKTIHNLATEHASSIEVLCGIELGLQPHLGQEYTSIIQKHSFDFIIGSTHVIHGEDPYYPKYFSTKDEYTAFSEYYKEILDNLNAFHDIDTLGHLDYSFRYGPYAEKNKDTYTPYRDIVDAILEFIIKHDIALEVNGGSFKYKMSEPNPTTKIIKRYHELGGKLITIGADAHTPEHIALGFPLIEEIIQSCGFHEYMVYKNRIPISQRMQK